MAFRPERGPAGYEEEARRICVQSPSWARLAKAILSTSVHEKHVTKSQGTGTPQNQLATPTGASQAWFSLGVFHPSTGEIFFHPVLKSSFQGWLLF